MTEASFEKVGADFPLKNTTKQQTIVLQARDVSVTVAAEMLVQPVSLTLKTGRPFTILGETGSGKSLLAQAIIGTLPQGLQAHGQVEIDTHRLDLRHNPKCQQRQFWGRVLAVLPQEPWLALDPLMPAQSQVAEGYALVRHLPWRQARQRAQTALSDLDLAGAEGKRPDQLSGGMAQRLAFAAARASGARIVVADEPTKGLDIERRDDIIALLQREIDEGGALFTITHDLELARRLGGDLAIMLQGKIVEQGKTEEILARPRHDYTRRLIKADPACWQPLAPQPIKRRTPILTARNLSVHRGGRLLFSNLDIELHPGEIVGVFGPSGCGKSTLGDILLGLATPDTGQVIRTGSLAPIRFQKLYQDPPAAFSRHATLNQLLHDLIKRQKLDTSRIRPLMQKMRLPEQILHRRADEVSGGELQRLALLRLLLLDPVFLFADEPTSRLDLITQEEITRLLVDFTRETGCATLLVSHDRMLLEKSADRLLSLAANERGDNDTAPLRHVS